MIRNNLLVLIAQKSQRDKKRLTPRSLAIATGINPYTIYGILNNTLAEYPATALTKLCDYFDCQLSDLLVVEDVKNAD